MYILCVYIHTQQPAHKDAIMEELVQGLEFVVVAMDGQDTIAKHVCQCPIHDITCILL